MGLFRNIFGGKGKIKLINQFPNLSIVATCFIPGREEIVVGLEGGEIQIIDFVNASVLKKLRAELEKPNKIGVSGDGTRLAILEEGKENVEVWDLGTGEKLHTINVGETANSVALSPDASRLAVGCRYKPIIHLFNALSGELDTVLEGHNPSVVQAPFVHRVNDIDFSPDGRFMVSAGDDAHAILWDLETYAGESLVSHEYVIWRVCFSHSGENFATGGSEPWLAEGREPFIGIREVGTMESDIFKAGAQDPVENIAYSVDDSKIVVTCRDDTAWIWSGHPEADRIQHEFETILTLSPDATKLASKADDTLKIWDITAVQE